MLAIPAFRRLWFALALSSLGDWLGLLATTALAAQLAGGVQSATFAIGGVLIVRMLPAVVLGPVAGAFADRFDRRRQMVICDLARFVLFVSIPLVQRYWYLLVASFVIESVSLFWIPAKEAAVPNLVPRAQLARANALSLITTYAMAPVAAAIFASLATFNRVLAAGVPFFRAQPVDVALYFDAATFLFSAITVSRISLRGPRDETLGDGPKREPNLVREILEGWRFVGRTKLIRGLVVGMLGAFAAGGVVIALGRPFVGVLGGGDAAYGLLFGAVFTGLASGMALGPKVLPEFSRRRLFGLCIVLAGGSLVVMSVLPDLILALLATTSVGFWAGVGWITGQTLLGAEVEDEIRGRTFAFVQSLVRVDLLVVLAFAPFVSGAIGQHTLHLFRADIRADGITVTLLTGGLVAIGVGLVSYRQMDDRPGILLWHDVLDAVRRRALPPATSRRGIFIALEGGDSAGKSTQCELLAEWLRERGLDVVATFEPGATPAGVAIRKVLLDRRNMGLDPAAEALLYAADRADHVASIVRPALDRGAVVVTDRYIDSSLAYQAGGRGLASEEVARLSALATGGLLPDLTVLLDLEPAKGRQRHGGPPDRMEAESLTFHRRVRTTYRMLAAREPSRYAVVDAGRPIAKVQATIRAAVDARFGAALEELAPVPPARSRAAST